MVDGCLSGSTLLLEARPVADQDEQRQALLQVALHVKRQRGTSVDLRELAEMLGLADAIDEHTSVTLCYSEHRPAPSGS